MGQIKKYIPVKLFIGMISGQKRLFAQAENILQRKFGAVDLKSGVMKFDFTDYYQKEMGKNLLRRFVSFKKLIDPAALASIKIFTNKTEKRLARKDASRRINLDPGYITQSSLVLATTKGFQHRIYLDKGIFAEVTLRYEKGAFRPYDWTYPDYRTEKYRAFFKSARGIYKGQLTVIPRRRV